ncbi:hypothetical protein CCR75_000475 [Bremia lactucae]|uniref:alpha-1,2-Mannosidase n=1 Tax=Bremia lactucae TaxID=4779 RepID=A0A976FKK9_BRELC|nr:hypothetical protein CCR75_000475 [Bremia lactucae]
MVLSTWPSMPPRQLQRDRLATTFRTPVKHSITTVTYAYTCIIIVFTALLFGVAQAKNQAQGQDHLGVLPHFNGLHALSGDSGRAFKNRLKRTMRGKSCLRHHVGGAWWHYEWCFDSHVRQFHTVAKGLNTPERNITLGVFDAHKAQSLRILAVDNLDKLADPSRMGYMVQQLYGSGDFCETQQAPRSVNLHVKCCVLHDNETYVEAVYERSPCEYVMNVCSPVACGLMQRDQFVLSAPTSMGEDEREALTVTVKEMFYHAYNGYLAHAFPQGDLLPLSCTGGEFMLGRLPMLTLIDTLDTLALLEDATEFRRAVKIVVDTLDFDLDTEVSVFETTIRVLGGLLSAHLFAMNTDLKLFPDGDYDGALLLLATDLGNRLMPAFDTVTGIPYGTVNLKNGVPNGETPVASTAGAGSLSIEFTMLSALTGEPKYATASRGAVRALFQRRSKRGLLGKHINTRTGEWTETTSGPGANSDSFYEYLMKMYELYGDLEALEMFAQVYPAVMTYNKHEDWYTDVSMFTGCHDQKDSTAVVVESLAAFWPGMQIAAGDLKFAAESMNSFYHIWRDYGFLPEQFNVGLWKPNKPRRGVGARYPLRPELIESTFYMHEATNDSSWLRAGAHVVYSLQKYTKTSCGYASIADVESKTKEDHMPSFFLSETCKYLYLLFNTSHFFRLGKYVMTTEAHPLPILPTKLVKPILIPIISSANDSESTSDRRFSPAQVLLCQVPKFYDLINYSLHYESKVVAYTSQCLPRASSPATLVGPSKLDADQRVLAAAGTNAISETRNFAATELKISELILDTANNNKGIKTFDELQERLLALEGKARPRSANHSKRKLSSQRLLTAPFEDIPGIETEQAAHYLYGGSQLGEFRVEQMQGRVRVTREENGDWIDASGIDSSYFLIGLGLHDDPENHSGADMHSFEKIKSFQIDQGDRFYPPYLGWNNVYTINDDLRISMDQRCLLRVRIGSTLSRGKLTRNIIGNISAENLSADVDINGKSNALFTLPCVGAEFGETRLLKTSRVFPGGELIMADPSDACDKELHLNSGKLQGKIVLVKRGECFFEEKARNAKKWGAAGVIVINNEDNDLVIVMEGTDSYREEASDDLLDVPVVMIPKRLGAWFEHRLAESMALLLPPVKVYVEVTVRFHDDKPKKIFKDDSFPRVELTTDSIRIYGPVWGIELETIGLDEDETRQEVADHHAYESFTVSIVSTPPW